VRRRCHWLPDEFLSPLEQRRRRRAVETNLRMLVKNEPWLGTTVRQALQDRGIRP